MDYGSKGFALVAIPAVMQTTDEKSLMKQRYLVNVGKKDIRVAVLEDASLVNLLIEPTEQRAILGNIYKGVISDIKPGIHAVFVDIGFERNAFLHFDDIQKSGVEFSRGIVRRKRSRPSSRGRGRRRGRGGNGERFDVAKDLQPGEELLVQVVKEGIRTKGPRVSTHVSLPGRYLVLLPFATQEGGISRKIDDVRERRRLRKILREINSTNQAYIVRTAGLDMPADEIMGDVGFLDRAWKNIRRKYRAAESPALIHNDHDILYRVVRDVISADAGEIWVDSRPEYNQMVRRMRQMIPALVEQVQYYSSPLRSVFDEFEVEKQIQKALRRKLWLRNGGYLIFDEMEAMTAIDVNTGKYTGGKDQDKTVYRTNLEAARSIAQQLRLRDIGGLIVIDFIDMEDKQHQRSLMTEFKRLLRRDKAKHAVLNLSEFGLVEMTRKRVRHSLKNFFSCECPVCCGSGQVLTREQVWRNIRRDLVTRLEEPPRPSFEITMHTAEKEYIETEHMEVLQKWSSRYRINIDLIAESSFLPEQFQVKEIERPKPPSARPRHKSKAGGAKRASSRKSSSRNRGSGRNRSKKSSGPKPEPS